MREIETETLEKDDVFIIFAVSPPCPDTCHVSNRYGHKDGGCEDYIFIAGRHMCKRK
jgi:hypothetical protein